jgi:predicted RNA binding protein with dsRBD fold (UPF0201 family)
LKRRAGVATGMVLVRIACAVHATEDPAKVEAAVRALFPDARIELDGAQLRATSDDLAPLRRRVWELRIIDAMRGKLLHGLAPDARSFRVVLSKQAALANKVSIPARPHALGELDVVVEVEAGDPWPDAERLAWWLAPETKDGEIVGPVDPS